MAHDAGLHVTVHAAESGPASNVRQAVEELHATRIGHGYRVIEDPSVYQLAKDKGVHFEVRVISLVRVIIAFLDPSDLSHLQYIHQFF